jgi:hypothetical protein
MIQERGHSEVLQDYHIRVGDVTADSDPPRQAPIHEQRFDETEAGAAKLVTLTEITPQPGVTPGSFAELASTLGFDATNDGVVDNDLFASIYNPGKIALLISWSDAKAANEWTPVKASNVQTLRHRKVRIIRDYGIFDRRESPQFYPDAEGRETRHSQPVR